MNQFVFKFFMCVVACFLAREVSAQSISITSTADTICAGSYVHFAASASGTATPHYQWLKNSVNVGTDSVGFTTASLANGDVIMCVLSSTPGGSAIAFSAPIVMTVYAVPSVAAISGATTVCRAATTTLSTTTTGGVWSSSTPGVANVNSAGVVLGNSGGTVTISYTVTNICGTANATHMMTVNTPPVVAGINGPNGICVGGAPATFTDSTAGGTWSSGNTAVATISSIGVVTPVALGSSTISYAITNTCGTTTRTKVVNVITAPSLSAITGATTLCQGDSVHLHNAAAGGVWSSSDAAIVLATGVGGGAMAFGLVAGIGGGTATVSYAVANQCGSDTATAVVTVNPLPLVYPISGADSVCPGTTIGWSNVATGGVWVSSNTSVVTVSSTGAITGVASGTAVITYSLSNDCGTTSKTKTVYVYCPANVGVATITNVYEVKVTPNPATDVLYVQGVLPASIKISNMMGQVLKQDVHTDHLFVDDLAAGVYFISIYSNGSVSTQRFVKQ